jgi:hypothetical protein
VDLVPPTSDARQLVDRHCCEAWMQLLYDTSYSGPLGCSLGPKELFGTRLLLDCTYNQDTFSCVWHLPHLQDSNTNCILFFFFSIGFFT